MNRLWMLQDTGGVPKWMSLGRGGDRGSVAVPRGIAASMKIRDSHGSAEISLYVAEYLGRIWRLNVSRNGPRVDPTRYNHRFSFLNIHNLYFLLKHHWL